MRPPEPANPPAPAEGDAPQAAVPLMMPTPKMQGYKGIGKGKDYGGKGYYWVDQDGGWHWWQSVTCMQYFCFNM